MSTFKLITLLVFTLLFIRCDKDKTVDPQATDPNTANSFSCYVNGVYWEAYADFTWGGAVALEGEYDSNNGYLGLKGTIRKNDNNKYEIIYFYCSNVVESGIYKMYVGDGALLGFVDLKNNHPCNGTYHDTINPGTLIISNLDKSKRLVQGTFSMTLKTPDCGPDSLMYITNGKFTFIY